MKEHIDTSGAGKPLGQNPFGALSASAFPAGAGGSGTMGANGTTRAGAGAAKPTSIRKQPNTNRGRVDVSRETAGRGGKTVTVITGFKGIAERELQELARTIQRGCGTGGTLKGAVIEIQGDQRERAAEVLVAAGFRPVMAGG